MAHNLEIGNRGNKATFLARNAETIIGITLSTANIANRVNKWRVQDPLHLTDQRRISFLVGVEKQPVKQTWNLKTVDWAKLSNNPNSYRHLQPRTVQTQRSPFLNFTDFKILLIIS